MLISYYTVNETNNPTKTCNNMYWDVCLCIYEYTHVFVIPCCCQPILWLRSRQGQVEVTRSPKSWPIPLHPKPLNLLPWWAKTSVSAELCDGLCEGLGEGLGFSLGFRDGLGGCVRFAYPCIKITEGAFICVWTGFMRCSGAGRMQGFCARVVLGFKTIAEFRVKGLQGNI